MDGQKTSLDQEARTKMMKSSLSLLLVGSLAVCAAFQLPTFSATGLTSLRSYPVRAPVAYGRRVCPPSVATQAPRMVFGLDAGQVRHIMRFDIFPSIRSQGFVVQLT
jgi:hypothetical protein